MTDLNDGTYSVDYTVPEEGTVTVSLVLVNQGGLSAEYFNNAFLDGIPTLSRVDSFIDFDWTTDLVTPEAGDYVSIHWHGKFKAPTTEDYTFIFNGDDGFRIYIDLELVVDRWELCCDEMTYRLALTKDRFYDLIIEYREF